MFRPRLLPWQGVDGGPWRRRDVQGELRFGLPHVIMVTEGAGTLRFPSGAEKSFDCEGKAGPVEVFEGDWLNVERSGDRLILTMNSPWWPEDTAWDLAVASADGSVRPIACQPSETGCEANVGPNDVRLMLRRDGRVWYRAGLRNEWPQSSTSVPAYGGFHLRRSRRQVHFHHPFRSPMGSPDQDQDRPLE